MTDPTFDEISASLAHHETWVFLAETLAGWRPPVTPEGRAVLDRHYRWAHRMRAEGRLLFAGPVDVESIGPGQPSPVGRVTGLLVFRAASREEAESLASMDPFHSEGYRRNGVHSLSIRFLQPEVDAALGTSLARPLD